MMRTALYFPHTEVRNKSIVHTALLLWDALECIVPDQGYRPQYADREMAAAMEIVGKKRTPTDKEKRRVHTLVKDLVQGSVPETFLYSPRRGQTDPYEIWPQKFLGATWDLLQDKGLTDRRLDHYDYPMSQAAGLSIMAILADVLAGETRARVTDRGLAYATIANAPKVAGDAEHPVQVVPLTLKGIAADRLPIDQLIAFRKREAKEDGSDYRALRRNYHTAIEKHIRQISMHAPGSPDRVELDRAFEADMEDDLRDLKRELGFSRRDAWLSKEVVTLAVAGGALLGLAAGVPDMPMPEVITGAGAVALVGGLLGTGNKLAKARYEILRKHPMAYLYEVTG
jgi:hypothetical protein